jgi:hypothetical protein
VFSFSFTLSFANSRIMEDVFTILEIRQTDNALVSIEEVRSGLTTLTCLYCGGGRIKSILEKLSKFEQAAERSKLINYRNLNERIADLRIYRVQFPRIRESLLYFL